jgi:AcrR family transcriptional regulator
MMWSHKPVSDRRIQRTQRLLHLALGALMHEKPYNAIAVKEILGRADVGRSTFYSHFRDKDDLLLSGIRAVLQGGRPAPRERSGPRDLLWFSRPMFEHIDQQHRARDRSVPTDGWAEVHAHLRHAVEELAADEIERCRRGAGSQGIPSELLARQIAATFVLVLDWWVENGSQLSVEAVDEHYRGLMQPIIAAHSTDAAPPPR